MAKKVTQADLAKHLGLTNSRSVRELYAQGVLNGDPRNIDLDQCRLEYIAHLRAVKAGWEKPKDSSSDSLDEKVQLALYRAELVQLAQIKKNIALGKLIWRRDMVIAVSGAFARVKSVLLRIARKNAAAIAAMDDEIEVREFLDEKIREGLDELASTPVEVIGREAEEDEIDLGDEDPDAGE
jgi:hypothetical protein